MVMGYRKLLLNSIDLIIYLTLTHIICTIFILFYNFSNNHENKNYQIN